MADITYTIKPVKILTLPNVEGYTNVVGLIYWEIEFTNGTYFSYAQGKAELGFADLGADFIPVEQIPLEKYQAWIMENIADHWPQLLSFHTKEIERQDQESIYDVYYDQTTSVNFLYAAYPNDPTLALRSELKSLQGQLASTDFKVLTDYDEPDEWVIAQRAEWRQRVREILDLLTPVIP